MNLVEYPFASLWTKEEAGSIIEQHWETQHPVTGRKVKASWRVTGDPELGLPGPSDERVYLALMELSREAGFTDPVVRFTRHDLLKRLGWTHNDKNYRLLVNSFRRLGAAFVSGENAFWDASIKSFRTIGFNILDHYDIVAEPPGRKKKDREVQGELPLSYFKWADVIFTSVQAGYIRTLDVGFALSLKGDLALRLFRYLDKKAYDGRRSFEIELSALCERHLGMKPTPYDSTRKARLKGAHEELLERGFLRAVTFAPMKTRKAEKACYTFGVRHEVTPAAKGAAFALGQAPEQNRAGTLAGTLPKKRDQTSKTSRPAPLLMPRLTTGDEVDEPEQAGGEDEMLLERILSLKVSAEVAQELVQSVSSDQLLLQLDCLEDREPRSRAATFVKAVREGWEAPTRYLERSEAAGRARQAQKAHEAAQAADARHKIAKRQEAREQEQEAARLDALWEQLSGVERDQLDAQARARLGVLGEAGRAPAALLAMRRNLLRDRLGERRGPQSSAPPGADQG